MANERITENIVRDRLRELGYYYDENIIIEEQSSKNPRINKLLQGASKKGSGVGRPEFIISFNDDVDLLVVIECKASTAYHESEQKDKYSMYAVDGVLLYSSYLAKDFNVISIAVSGESEKKIKISNFLQIKKSFKVEKIKDRKILKFDDYLSFFRKKSKPLEYEELVGKAVEYNDLFQKHSIPETERSTYISSILVALQDKFFSGNFAYFESNKDLVDGLLNACHKVLDKSGIKDHRKDIILKEYSDIKYNKLDYEESEVLEGNNNNPESCILKDLIIDIHSSVLPSLLENNFDVLGLFYREFIRYAGSDASTGLVLTPNHITDLFCEIANLQLKDVVYDPCCGTGGFLVSSMKYMLSLSEDTNEHKKIKEERLIGIEERSDMFTHACSNMMMRGDGKSNIHKGSCFNSELQNKVKLARATKTFLNPPYDRGASEQLNFLLNALNLLDINGVGIAICQMSTATSLRDKELKSVREELFANHTLEAVFSMPVDLFHPSASVPTCIIVFTAGVPHSDDKKTFFGYLRDDGFIKKKNRGRIDSGTWEEKKLEMLSLYRNKKEKVGLSITKKVTIHDEWCAEAYLETDYSGLGKDNFIDVMRQYIAFRFSQGDILEATSKICKKQDISLNVDEWKWFNIHEKREGLFKVEKGERLTKEKRKEGSIPLLTATSINNGVAELIDKEIFEKNKKIRENKLTVDMFFNVFYHGYEYFSDDNIHSFTNISIETNKYIEIFLCGVLRKEQYKFAYGRQVRIYRLEKTKIKLPAKKNEKGEYEPDWQFMEDYIKSLPYSSNL